MCPWMRSCTAPLLQEKSNCDEKQVLYSSSVHSDLIQINLVMEWRLQPDDEIAIITWSL